MFGIKIPRTVEEALKIDKENNNTLWREATMKEIKSLLELDVFKFHLPGIIFTKDEGWQYAPLHMIFTIKQQYLRHKARLVAGGNVVDASMYLTSNSMVQILSI